MKPLGFSPSTISFPFSGSIISLTLHGKSCLKLFQYIITNLFSATMKRINARHQNGNDLVIFLTLLNLQQTKHLIHCLTSDLMMPIVHVRVVSSKDNENLWVLSTEIQLHSTVEGLRIYCSITPG